MWEIIIRIKIMWRGEWNRKICDKTEAKRKMKANL